MVRQAHHERFERPKTSSNTTRLPFARPTQPLDEQLNALFDATLSGDGSLTLLDSVDEPLTVGNGEGMEGLLRLAARRHGLGEVGGNGYLPLLFVVLDLDINEITHVDAQLPPDTAVHEEAVLPSPTRREIGPELLRPRPCP